MLYDSIEKFVLWIVRHCGVAGAVEEYFGSEDIGRDYVWIFDDVCHDI